MKPFRLLLPPPRPLGSGAFWDYAEASARRQKGAARVRAGRPGIRLARLAAEREQAEQRWDNEGGKTAL